MEQYLTAEDVAEALQLTKRTVEKHARNGTIPGRQIGNTWRFSQKSIDDWMNPQNQRVNE